MKPWTILTLAAVLALASGCEMTRKENSRDTFLDPEIASVALIDVAVVQPAVEALDAPTLVPVIRQAARAYLVGQKDYSVVGDPQVDSAVGGMNGASDASALARAADADCAVAIQITVWDTSALVPRGRIYASGTVRIAAHSDGRRLYEQAFENELLLAPSSLSSTSRIELQKAMATELVHKILAGFPRKKA